VRGKRDTEGEHFEKNKKKQTTNKTTATHTQPKRRAGEESYLRNRSDWFTLIAGARTSISAGPMKLCARLYREREKKKVEKHVQKET